MKKLAQVALNYGADDLDGTIIEERITHEAGATSAIGLTRDDMERMIRDAGFLPVETGYFLQCPSPGWGGRCGKRGNGAWSLI